MKLDKRDFLRTSLLCAGSGLATSACTMGNTKNSSSPQNLLFLSIDDLNAWVVDAYRHPLTNTPNIDRLMSQSYNFVNAQCAAPVCASSRAALMTGVAPHVSGMYTNANLPREKGGGRKGNAHTAIPDVPHLVDLFRKHDYLTLGAGKIYHRWVSDEENHGKHYHHFMPELEVPSDIKPYGHGYGAKKFYPFPKTNPIVETLGIKQGQSLVAGPVDRETNMFNGKMPDELVSEWAQAALANVGKAPFYMAIGFMRPHVPYTAPKKYFDAIPLDAIELPEVDDMKDIPMYGKAMTMGLVPSGDHAAVLALGETYWKQLIQGYLASINFVDDQIGIVLDALVNNGHDDNTAIVLFSDHGQNFGEKANWRKMCLWEESTRVPLIIRPAGGLRQAQYCKQVVSLLDVYPTLCNMFSLPKHEKLFGRDLTPLFDDPSLTWETPALVSWHYQNFAVRENRWKLIRYRDGAMELYDHKTDPAERNNLISDSQYAPIVKRLLKSIPSNPSLPLGYSSWTGDKLDDIIKEWENSAVPEWL